MRTLPASPIRLFPRHLALALGALAAVGALAALPSAAATQQAPAQQASAQPAQTSRAAAAAAADDSLEAWRLSAPALGARCSDAIGRARKATENLLAGPQSEGTAFRRLQAIEQINAELQRVTTMPRTLQVISADDAVRDTSVACDKRVTALTTAVLADPRLYALAQHAGAELGAGGSPPDRQLAKLYVEAGRKAGAGLDSAGRVQAVRLLQRHADLERDFSLALAGDSSTIRIPRRDTVGLDPQFRARLERTGDSLTVHVDESTITPFMRFQRDRDARHRFFLAYNRLGGQANVARLDSALAVRDTIAHLLGFQNWAAYQLSTRMAKDPGQVMDFLSGLERPLHQKAVSEVAELTRLARKDGVTGALQAWDYAFYAERLRQTRYALSQTVVQQYFPVDYVLPQVMRLYSQLLGVRFEPITTGTAWAPEVSQYAVIDSATGRPMAHLYFDLYPRPHKYQHFADFTVVPGMRLADGSRQLPWTAIIGNWPVPAPGHPSLLAHSDVVVLFHEFGHAMAAALDQSPYPTTSNYRLDFVEAPSQMLENWMWQPAILKRISRNVTTSRPLPDSLIRRMIEVKHLTDGNFWGAQVFYATYDMTLHTAKGPIDPTRTWDELYPRYLPFTQPANTWPEAGFGHIMGGYEAGYYGYLWSKRYAQDMFTRFEREGILNPRTGRAYRNDVLAPSGTEEPDVLVQRFLGRPVSDSAFYRELGIARK
jgi:thimet oligopeptidase